MESKNDLCEVCHKAKQTRESFPISQHQTKDLGHMVHMDVWSPYKVQRGEGYKNFLTLVDDYTRTSSSLWFSCRDHELRAGLDALRKKGGESIDLDRWFCFHCVSREWLVETSCLLDIVVACILELLIGGLIVIEGDKPLKNKEKGSSSGLDDIDQYDPLFLHYVFMGEVFSKNAKVVWNELEETYSKHDPSVIFYMHFQIHSLSQSGSALSEYYHKFNALWRQYDSLVNLCDCICENSEKLKKHNQLLKLMQFLMGLDDVSCDNHDLSIFGNQSIERDRLIGIGFVLDFVELTSFTFGDKEMILWFKRFSDLS
ncbi:ribonuclease H-like domain-containing protein, partial [Tanacetum coccineum]